MRWLNCKTGLVHAYGCWQSEPLRIVRNPSSPVRQAGGAGCTAWGAKGRRVTKSSHLTLAARGDCKCCNHTQPLCSVLSITPRLGLCKVYYSKQLPLCSGGVWKLLLRSQRFSVSKIMSTYRWCVTTWTSCWQGQAGALAGGQQLLGSGTPSPLPVVVEQLFPSDTA